MRNILILTFSFLFFTLAAQEKVSEQHIGWKGTSIHLHTISNKELSCTFILGIDSVKVFVLDNNANIIQVFTLNRNGYEKFLGSFIKNGNIYLYMDNAENPGLHTWVLNIADKSIKENIVPFKIKRDKVINRLSSETHFFYFTMNKKSSEFVIYDFKDESHYDTLRFTVEPDMWNNIRENVLSLSPSFNIENVNMEGECNIEIAKSLNKTYIHNDSLFLLSNKIRSVTTVYVIDLNNKKMTSRLIKHNHDGLNEQPEVVNSFLLNNKLYYVSASQVLFLQVVDFYSGNIQKEFSANVDEEIAFKNTPIIQEGGNFGAIRELGKTRQLLRKMTNGTAVITAYADVTKKQVQLLVGSYIKQSGGGGGMTMSPGYSAGGTFPMFITTGGFSTGSWNKSARFKMLLDSETNEHITGELSPSINERIEEYSKGKKIPSEGENLFIKNGKYFYAFYDKEKRTFNIVKF